MSNCTFAPGADGIRPIKYSNGVMSLIDQRLLPVAGHPGQAHDLAVVAVVLQPRAAVVQVLPGRVVDPARGVRGAATGAEVGEQLFRRLADPRHRLRAHAGRLEPYGL